MNSSAVNPPTLRRRASIGLLALVTSVATTSGCVGYSRSAKRWAYLGNSTLLAVGGGAMALGILTYDTSCPSTAGGSTSTNACVTEVGPVSGITIAGAALVISGIVGVVLTATRPLPRNAQR